MGIRSLFTVNQGTKVVLRIAALVSLFTILFAFFYYRQKNRVEDPRILKARLYLQKFDEHSGGIHAYVYFPYLDSAEAIFLSLPDYRNSFERGIIYNNKCSGFLLLAIYDSTLVQESRLEMLNLAMSYCDSSITVYKQWMQYWDSIPENEISVLLKESMDENDPAFKSRNYEKILHRRAEYIREAKQETPRRLSVGLTNKGTLYRHMHQQDSALACYQEALALWKYNRVAKSNLQVLLGGEPIKPSLIESLFPPDKSKP